MSCFSDQTCIQILFCSCFRFSAISDNEKREIKCLLLSESFKEPVPQIAIQIAVLIGNISRFDYPQDWNEVKVILFNFFAQIMIF